MRLPGVKRLGVQSLGRSDSELAGAAQMGDSKVFNAAAESIETIAGAVDKAIVTPAYEREAVSQYAKGEADRAGTMAETEATLNNPTGMVSVDEIPEGVKYEPLDKDGNYRKTVPTHEVAQQWYKQKLKDSQASAVQQMSNNKAIRKMKLDYGTAFVDNYAGVLVRAQKRKQSFELATIEQSAERFVEAGDQDRAEKIWAGAIKTGTIGPKAGTEKLMAIPGDIDTYRVSKTIHTSTLAELDGIESYIYRDYNFDAEQPDGIKLNEDGSRQQNPMSFAQRKRLIGELEGRRKSLISSTKTGKDENSARALNEQLILLQEDQVPLDEDTLRDKKMVMTPEDHRTLITANKSLKVNLKGKSDPKLMGTLQSDINSLMINDPNQPLNIRRAGIVSRINAAIDAELINSQDAWSLIQRTQQVQELPFKNPDMDLAVDQIYKRLTRGSKSSLGLNTDPQSAINAADAERDLYEAAQAAGPEFDPLAWMDDNFARYQTKNIAKNSAKLLKSKAKPYVIRDKTTGLVDFQASRMKVAEASVAGTIEDDVAIQALQSIADAEEMYIQAEEAKKKKADKSWWEFN